MARDWMLRNNNAGNVLKTQGITVDMEEATGSGDATPNANISVLNMINLGVGDSELNIDASNSIIGDVIILLIQIPGAGVANVDLGGDAAPGRCSITGDATVGGVGAYYLVFNGISFFATATPVAIP